MICITLIDFGTEFFQSQNWKCYAFLCNLPYFRIILCFEQNVMIFYDFMPRGTPELNHDDSVLTIHEKNDSEKT